MKSHREKTIIRLYNDIINTGCDIDKKYRCYQFLKYLMSIFDKRFENEFNINNDELLDTIINIIKENYINNLDMLKIAANVARHVE